MQQKRTLGIWICTSLVMGNMIGSGVFMVPASLAPYGWLGIGGWLFTTAGAIVMALLFARLAQLMPKVGGPYAYSRAAYGDFIGFQAAWGYWLSIWAGNADIAVALVGYLSVFFPVLGESRFAGASAAVTAVWLLAAVNIAGVRQAGLLQLITTALKLAPLLIIGLVGVFAADAANFTPNLPPEQTGLNALAAAGAITLWAFLGLESATIPAENVVDPRRTIPRATVFGVLGAAVVYILGSIAVMGVVPPDQLATSNAPYADAAASLWGSGARLAIACGAVIATFGALNGWMLLSGQVPYAMALDDMMPPVFRKLSKGGTPYFGILFSSIIITSLLLLNFAGTLAKTFEFIALLATLACLVPYVYCSFAEMLIRLRQPELPGRLGPWGMALSMIGFVYVMWAVGGSGERTVYLGFLMITAGIPVYAWLRRARPGSDA